MRRSAMLGMALIGLVGASAPAIAARPPADPLAGFAKSCQTQMYMSAPACACVVAKAKADLDDKEIAYLSIAGYNGPEAAAAAKAMSGAEIANVDKFMHTAVPQCEGAK
jgi:hypothetical protein